MSGEQHVSIDPDNPIGEKPPGAPEFSVRAVVVGLIVAAMIAASYPYAVMKLGFGPNISVVSAFFGYLILGLAFRTFNRWENNVVQTAGTAGGQTAFMCALMAAFDLLRRDPELGFTFDMTPMQSFLWLTTAGTLGALLAVPMRQHFIVDEKLRYPDGVAVAETLVVLDSRGRAARRSALALVAGTLASAKLALLVFFKAIPGHFYPSKYLGTYAVGMEFSFLAYGSGMIIGMRVNTSMIIGGLISWVVAPYLLVKYGITPDKRGDVLLWVMWPATGMLVAGGLAALIFRWRVLGRTFSSLRKGAVGTNDFPMKWVIVGVIVSATALVFVQEFALQTPWWMTLLAILLSVPLMLVGLRVLGETNWGPISALSNLMQGLFRLIAPGHLQANIVSSGVTGTVAVESEALMQDFKTGWLIGGTPRHLTVMQILAVPVGALVVSFMYPLLRDSYGLNDKRTVVHERVRAPKDSGAVAPDAPNVFVIAHAAEAKQIQEKDTLVLRTFVPDEDQYDGKRQAAHGSFAVTAVAGARVTLDQPIPPELRTSDVRWRVERTTAGGLASPISNKWYGFARLLQKPQGIHTSALWFLALGVILGIAFTGLEQIRSFKPYAPSPTGIGIGMLVPFQVIFMMFLGGLTELIWRKINQRNANQYVIPMASGMIAGEAIVYTVLPILVALGLLSM